MYHNCNRSNFKIIFMISSIALFICLSIYSFGTNANEYHTSSYNLSESEGKILYCEDKIVIMQLSTNIHIPAIHCEGELFKKSNSNNGKWESVAIMKVQATRNTQIILKTLEKPNIEIFKELIRGKDAKFLWKKNIISASVKEVQNKKIDNKNTIAHKIERTNSSINSSYNYVKNPSFEEMNKFPEKLSSIEDCTDWSNPTGGTPDYFTFYSNKFSSSVPINATGNQYARTGKCYAGIIAYKKEFRYNEYIQGELMRPLKAGKKYKVSFYASCSEISNYCTNQLGAYFSNKKMDEKEFFARYDNRKILNKSKVFFSDPNKWVKFTETYVATGKEKYIIIGNIQKINNRYSITQRDGGTSNIAYLYIDDISVIEEEYYLNENNTVKNESGNEIKVGQKLTLAQSDYIFVHGTSRILSTHYIFIDGKREDNEELVMLKYLANFLKINKNVKIEISVHTDDRWGDEKCLVLSELQAKSIRNYLVKSNVKKSRISLNACGSKYPICKNDTAEHKKKNRRVEFTITDI